MPHPFFDSDSYPWERADAKALHEALWKAVSDSARIDVLYRASGSDLPPLPLREPADDIWKRALEALATARRLKEFCTRLMEDRTLAGAHDTIRIVIDAEDVMDVSDTALDVALQPKVFESLKRGRLALGSVVDRSFVAERLVRRVNVLPPDAQLETEEILRSVTQADCTEVVRILVTDSPAEFQQLRVSAEIELPNESSPFPAVVRGKSADDHKFFRISFGFRGRVVLPGGTLTLRWRCFMPSSVALRSDYWVFPFIFQAPAQRMTLEASFDREPDDVGLLLDQFEQSGRREDLKHISLTRPRKEHLATGERVVYSVDLAQTSGTYLFTWTLAQD